ncbi:MAG: pyridoxamine 5'-phosphate oxidase family protein [Actinomycetota bacterium]|nr:pyridoxamine 5'-phosphate oxidase family protein [Actinomycetota bacterium]MDQ6945005.1 pyridoxamine 5'-phosphate oxidase family protein [Actinomycetota bacterium]
MGLSIGALPVILPVNFAVVEGDIINPTAAGAKLDAAINPVVAFEVNGFDPSGTAAGLSWSKASPKSSPTQATYRGSGGSASAPLTGVDGHLVRAATEFLSHRRHETVGTRNVSR